MGISGLLKECQNNFPDSFFQIKKRERYWCLLENGYELPFTTKTIDNLYVDFNSQLHKICLKFSSLEKKRKQKEEENKKDTETTLLEDEEVTMEEEEEITEEEEEIKERTKEEKEEERRIQLEEKIGKMSQIEVKKIDQEIIDKIVGLCRSTLVSLVRMYNPKKVFYIVGS